MYNQTKEYIGNLRKLDFQFDDPVNSSIYLVDKLEYYIANPDISPYIIIALDRAKSFEADAVYFRFFDDTRPPMPQMYIYDNILNTHTEDKYAEIHRAIWSGCEIPVYMVIDKTQIKVFDSRKPVDIKNNKINTRPIDIIDLSAQSDALKKYRSQLFNNGAFWETDEASRHFQYKTATAERLIKGLKAVRLKFNWQIRDAELADRLLIMCILIKYLEENGIDINTNRNLAHDFFYRSTGFQTLTEILYHNRLPELLDALSGRFNGGIFLMTDKSDAKKDWDQEIRALNLRDLAVFFDAGASENLFGWSEYSFEHIPIELISNLYEEFLPKEKKKRGQETATPENGAVYTPSFLVNMLVDENLPLTFNDINENIKLIDPACGSGIFLVTAYKRLVQRWRLKNRSESKLADTNPPILKDILSRNIFGVDIHYNAVHLTVFSLQLALCSMLTPRQIWTELGQFNDLEQHGNIVEKDFFNYLAEDKFEKDFDLVIGNPPFKELAKKEFITYKNKLAKFEENEKINLQIPLYQEVLLFLSTSFLLLKKQTGKLCLIMKSGPFLYSGNEDNQQNTNLMFRSLLFNQYNVTQIIDFTLLKNLFRAKVETAAVFIENKPAENNAITHIVIRESRPVVEKSYFEINHYDFYKVPLSIATSEPYVWKCNLLGGAQVYDIVTRLKKQQKLEICLIAEKSNGWDYGQGYKIGNKSKKDLDNLITEKNTIVDKEFKDNGIGKVIVETGTNFETIPANAHSIFSPPHLVIKKTIGGKHIPLELRDDYLTFRNEIMGIHCPAEQREKLHKLATQLKNNNDILRFYIVATSARSGVIRSVYTSDLSDLLNLPLLEDETFKMNEAEQIIIDDVLNYYIEEFGRGSNAVMHKNNATEEQIKSFSKVYCDSLNKIYADDKKTYHLSKLKEGEAFYACEYTFGADNDYMYEPSNENLNDLLYAWNPSNSVKYCRIMRIYGENIIRIVKPKKLLFWLQSTALRDFGDTLDDALNDR
jgi:type I restriction-modification system DNA methylase subunit